MLLREVALGTLLRGCSRQPDYNVLASDIWFLAAQQACALSLWHVPSSLNLADAPTRREKKAQAMLGLARAGFLETQWSWPATACWPVP